MHLKNLLCCAAFLAVTSSVLTAQEFVYTTTPVGSLDGAVVAEAQVFFSAGCLEMDPPQDPTRTLLLPLVPPSNLIDCSGTGSSPSTDQSWQGMAHSSAGPLVETHGFCTRSSTASADASALIELAHEPTLIQAEGTSKFSHQSSSEAIDCTDPTTCTTGSSAESAIDGDTVGEPLSILTIPFQLSETAEALIQPRVDVVLDPGSVASVARSSITWEFELLGGIWEDGSLSDDQTPSVDCVLLPAGDYTLRIGHSNQFEVVGTQSLFERTVTNVLTGNDCWELRIELLACPSDINDDGVVDVIDENLLLAAWGPCPGCPEDINGDGTVDVSDLLQLLAEWGECPSCANQ